MTLFYLKTKYDIQETDALGLYFLHFFCTLCQLMYILARFVRGGIIQGGYSNPIVYTV